MYGGIFLLSLRGCVYSVVFVLLYLCCCVCAVGFTLLCLCCWVCAVVFVLLCLCCWVYSVVFTLLCPEFCPPLLSRCCLFHCSFPIYAGFYAMVWFWIYSLLEAPLCPISPIISISCFLISLDFGYISCFLLLYIHFSHHSFLDFPRHGLFLDIFTSWSSI